MNLHCPTLVLIALSNTVGESLAEDNHPALGSDSVAESPAVAVETPTRFLRIREVNGRREALETAVTRYAADVDGGVTVDLVAAVHIGDRSYYARLNKLFDRYDAVLYELVAPEGTTIPRGGRGGESGHPVALLQSAARHLLQLESQLERIDYTRPHFVRADLTPGQIKAKMEARGETAVTVALSTLADVLRQSNLAAQNPQAGGQMAEISSPEELFALLSDPPRLKQMLARQFAETGTLDEALGGKLHTMLVVDRNQAALRGLQQQLALGRRKIAIFYGAAHMPDFERRLGEDFGLRKTEQVWIEAWKLN